MKKITILLAAALVLMATACRQKEEKPVVPEIYNIGIKTASVPSTGGEMTISFTSNVKWTASSDASWISFDKASGNAGEFYITAKAQKNNTGDVRTAEITVSAEDKSFVVPVEQDQNDVFGVSVSAIDASYEGGDFSVTVSSNIKFEVKSSAEWVTVTETKSVTDSRFTVSVTENTSIEGREASVSVSSSEGTISIPVKQEGGLTDMIVAAEYIYYGDYYENGTANWVLHLFNEGYYYGNSEPSCCYSFDIVADKTLSAHNCPAGLPDGEYILDNSLKAGTLNIEECCIRNHRTLWSKATLNIQDGKISATILDEKGKTHKIKWTINPEMMNVEDNTYSSTIDKDYDIAFNECRIKPYGQYYKTEYGSDIYFTVLEFIGGTPDLGSSDAAIDTFGSIGICSETEDITGTYVLKSTFDTSLTPGTISGPDTMFYSYDSDWYFIEDGVFNPGNGTLTITKDGDSYIIEGSFEEDYPYGDRDLHKLAIHFKGEPEFVDTTPEPESITALTNRSKTKSPVSLLPLRR